QPRYDGEHLVYRISRSAVALLTASAFPDTRENLDNPRTQNRRAHRAAPSASPSIDYTKDNPARLRARSDHDTQVRPNSCETHGENARLDRPLFQATATARAARSLHRRKE